MEDSETVMHIMRMQNHSEIIHYQWGDEAEHPRHNHNLPRNMGENTAPNNLCTRFSWGALLGEGSRGKLGVGKFLS